MTMKYSVFTTVVSSTPSISEGTVDEIRDELYLPLDAKVTRERDRVTFQYSIDVPKPEDLMRRLYKTAYPDQYNPPV